LRSAGQGRRANTLDEDLNVLVVVYDVEVKSRPRQIDLVTVATARRNYRRLFSGLDLWCQLIEHNLYAASKYERASARRLESELYTRASLIDNDWERKGPTLV
jgi:hypothetical protein